MYKNIYYDYTTLASGVATTQIVDMDLHPYAKNIMFRMQLQGSGTLVYENSINGANWFEITGSETVIPTAAAAASAPVYASMNNGLSPLLPLKFLRVKLKTGAVVTSTTSENVYTISN
jgi:hypothetical protein